jgi:hypothetical protein
MNLGKMGRFGFVASLLAAAWGCSDMASPEDTYNTVVLKGMTGGSSGDGDGEGPDRTLLNSDEWKCLGTPVAPVPRGAPTRIKYVVQIGDFDVGGLIPNLLVQACVTTNCDPLPDCPAGMDPTPTQSCAIVTPPSAALPAYTINLPYGLSNGGLKLTEPVNYVEMDYFFGGPMIGLPELALADGGDTVVGLAIPVIKKTTRQRVYDEVGVPVVDSTRGVVAVRTLNCLRQPATGTPTGLAAVPQGQRAARIAVKAIPDSPEDSVPWTLSTGNSFSPNKLVTDGRGVAGFLNAPSQITDLIAVLPDGVSTILPTSTSTRVRADVITLAELRPGVDVWGQ